MAIIACSRSLGTRSQEILGSLAERLSYRLVDKQLIAWVADAAEVPPQHVERFDDSGETRQALRTIYQSAGKPAVPIVAPPVTPAGLTFSFSGVPIAGEESHVLDHLVYQRFVRKMIEELADAGNVIIAGRGAGLLLEGRPHLLSVRLTASEEFRIETQMEHKNVEWRTAAETVRQSDRRRADYIKRHFHADWEDPGLYHLALNTELTGVEVAAATIAGAAAALEESAA